MVRAVLFIGKGLLGNDGNNFAGRYLSSSFGVSISFARACRDRSRTSCARHSGSNRTWSVSINPPGRMPHPASGATPRSLVGSGPRGISATYRVNLGGQLAH